MGFKQDYAKESVTSRLELAPRYQYLAEEAAGKGNEKAAESLRKSAARELEKAEKTFAKYPGLDRSEVEALAAEKFASWREKHEGKAAKREEKAAKREEKILDAQTRPVRQGSRRAEVGSYRLSRKQVKALPAWVKTAIDAEARAKATWEDAPPLTKAQRIYRARCKEEYLARSEEAKEAHQYLATLEQKGLGVGGAVAAIGISAILF